MITKMFRGVVRDGRIETTQSVDAPYGSVVLAYVHVAPPPEAAKMITFGADARVRAAGVVATVW